MSILNNITFEEYLEIINKEKIIHPESAYDKSIPQKYSFEPDFFKLKDFKRFGLKFELKKQIIDKVNENYFKYDNKNQEYIRDEKGDLIKLSIEEKLNLFKKNKKNRYEINYAIYDENGEMVARTQDEYGCLLVTRKEKYKGFGFGEDIVFEFRKTTPEKVSGGFTPSGYRNIKSVFRRIVLENEKNGVYNDLSPKRKEEIIDSVSNFKTFEERNKDKLIYVNYNMDDEKDFLYHIKDRFILIYNKKLFNIMKENNFDLYNDKYENLIKKGIIGYVSLYGNSETNRIYNFYSKNIKIRDKIMSLFSKKIKNNKFEIYKEDNFLFDDMEIIKKRDFNEINVAVDCDYDLKILSLIEKKERNYCDKYDELFNTIHEFAETISKVKNNNKKRKIKLY